MIWTDDRVEELDRLQALLREVSMIDHGNRVLERLELCIKLAEQLRCWRQPDLRKSFIDWLRYQAVEDRERNKEKS